MLFQLTKFGSNRTSTFQIRSLSHFQPIYNLTSDDLWPWYVTFDLINKWGFLCCIYDPTLVEIHQTMWKVESNVNLFSQQQTTTVNNNRGQSDPYVSFQQRQVTQKLVMMKQKGPHNADFSPYIWLKPISFQGLHPLDPQQGLGFQTPSIWGFCGKKMFTFSLCSQINSSLLYALACITIFAPNSSELTKYAVVWQSQKKFENSVFFDGQTI